MLEGFMSTDSFAGIQAEHFLHVAESGVRFIMIKHATIYAGEVV